MFSGFIGGGSIFREKQWYKWMEKDEPEGLDGKSRRNIVVFRATGASFYD